MDKLKIGGVDYEVKTVKGMADNGTIDNSLCVIEINEGLSGARRKEVLWHEVVHALSHMGHVGLSEKQTDQLGHLIHMVLVDNPWMGKT